MHIKIFNKAVWLTQGVETPVISQTALDNSGSA